MNGSCARLRAPACDLRLVAPGDLDYLVDPLRSNGGGSDRGPLRRPDRRASRPGRHRTMGSLPRMGATWTGHFAAASGLLLFAFMTPRGVGVEQPGNGER